MARPDFLIIGAMKCGTSTLAAQLGDQHGIFMTTPKEPNFFSDDAIYARGIHWYEKLFDAAQPDEIKGEASTHYTKLPTYPDTIKRMLKVLEAPRLVYIIRNPIDRAISHYIHEWTEGRMSADPVSAFDRHPELIDYGRYAMQIAPFVDVYGRDAIWITSLERLTNDPATELMRIGQHIGMTKPAIWNTGIGQRNISSERVRKLPLHNLLVANPVATKLRRTLVPQALRAHIKQARLYGQRPKLPESFVKELAVIFADDLERLKALNLPGTIDSLSASDWSGIKISN